MIEPALTSPPSRHLRQRQRKDRTLRYAAKASVGLALSFLFGLIAIVFISGMGAFWSYEVELDASTIASTPRVDMLIDGPVQIGPNALSDMAQYALRSDMFGSNLTSTTGSDLDDILEIWQSDGRVTRRFNLSVLSRADSQSPRRAGIAGALAGTLMILSIAAGLALPLGIGTALYLSEFAPQDRMTRGLKVNIDNLAAIPPILFGVLGLAVLIGTFGFARAIPLVAGFVLALRIFPTVVISARTALENAPQGVVDGALALGASPMQAVLQQKLRVAAPGILTGCLLAISQALSETAPLLLIGMVAFVTRVPNDLTDPATALPVQIYTWSTRLEAGWIDRASVAVLVLLAVILIINGLAIWIRARAQTGRSVI